MPRRRRRGLFSNARSFESIAVSLALNWHYLFSQAGELVAVHARRLLGERLIKTNRQFKIINAASLQWMANYSSRARGRLVYCGGGGQTAGALAAQRTKSYLIGKSDVQASSRRAGAHFPFMLQSRKRMVGKLFFKKDFCRCT